MESQLVKPPEAPARPELSFEQTVPKRLVHVHAISEVFATDAAKVGEDEWVVAAQLPRAHELWNDRLFPYHDPLVTLEVGRQTVFLIIHRHYEVPVDYKFVMRRFEFQVTDLEAYRDNEHSPPEGYCRGHLTGRQDWDGVVGMGFDGDLTIGDRQAMRMSGEINGLRRNEYQLLRGQSRGRKRLEGHTPPPGRKPREAGEQPPEPKPLDAAEVGRRDVRNVVIQEASTPPSEEGEHRFSLIVDETHPAFYDHPHDHVTGSMLLELYRQSAIAAAHRSGAIPTPVAMVTRCLMGFKDFAEPEAETECAARVTSSPGDGTATVSLTVHQLGKQIADAEIDLLAHGG